jgi:hypothetical protein
MIHKHRETTTAVSRRQVMTIGIAGLTWLVFPCREAFSSWDTLGDQLVSEMEKFAEDLVFSQIPLQARQRFDDAFTDNIRTPVLSALSGASPPERAAISSNLGTLQDFLGDVIQDWTGRTLRGGNVLDTLNQSLELRLRLEQPTFQHSFDPGFSYELGFPKPSTTQPPLEMLQNLRNGDPVLDLTQVGLNWPVFEMHANSDFDSLGLKGSVHAERLFDSSGRLISPQWGATGTLGWTMYQNGGMNHLDVQLQGEFNKDNSGNVWTLSFGGQFMF